MSSHLLTKLNFFHLPSASHGEEDDASASGEGQARRPVDYSAGGEVQVADHPTGSGQGHQPQGKERLQVAVW